MIIQVKEEKYPKSRITLKDTQEKEHFSQKNRQDCPLITVVGENLTVRMHTSWWLATKGRGSNGCLKKETRGCVLYPGIRSKSSCHHHRKYCSDHV